MSEQTWYVGRYLSGFWVAGGSKEEYESDNSLTWWSTVTASSRSEAIRKAKPKYYRARKAGDAV